LRRQMQMKQLFEAEVSWKYDLISVAGELMEKF
jgi:hypothetical protein